MDEDVEAFRAAGWDLQAKGRLRDLLYRLLTGDEDGEANMMILVGEELTESMLKYVRKYLEAGWSVQIYTFRSKGRKEVERLRSESPDMFHSVFLDRFVNFLLKDGENLELLAPQTTAKVTSSAETARCNGRYVFMNADAITQIYGKKFYKKVPGATKTEDIRLNFGALTTLACGGDKTDVKRQVAICGAANEFAVKRLQRRGWMVYKQKAAGTVMGTLLQKLEELASSASSGALKTLVLLIGSEAQSLQDREKWDRVIIALLKKNWCIEVLFWHRSVSRKFRSARKAYPNQITLVALATDLLCLSEKACAAKKLSNITSSASAAAPLRAGSSSVSTTNQSEKMDEVKEDEYK